MNTHTLMDIALWVYAGISFVSFVVEQTRKSAPKRNRRLPAPSIHCERMGDYEVKMHGCALTRRQAT